MQALSRVYCQGGRYLVSVRYPGQWHNLQDFVQPDNPDVIAIFSQYGPDPWALYDFVCKSVSYCLDWGEFFQFPSETLARELGDCEDTSILLTSLLKAGGIPAHVALGDYQGYGHSWVIENGFIYETTFTHARIVPDPQDYCPYVYFDNQQVFEVWPNALAHVFQIKRDEQAKLNLIAGAIS
ncbi:hypothetical protein ES704_01614 [subsurface metagenome]|jgi:hypothetical protein